MKPKHIKQRIQNCLSLASLSPCTRRQFGCVVIDPDSNVILSEGYNGGLRGGIPLCGDEGLCSRELLSIESGEKLEVGCVHAECNAIYNAARLGTSLLGSWFIINGEPCKICAKAIIQVGASRVICIGGVYDNDNGLNTLRKHGVDVKIIGKDLESFDYSDLIAPPLPLFRAPQSVTNSPFQRDLK